MLELSKSDRGDEIESVKISELLHGPHSRGKEMSFMELYSFLIYNPRVSS